MAAPNPSSVLGLHQMGPSFYGSQRLQAVRFGYVSEPNNVFDLKHLKTQLILANSAEERMELAAPFLQALKENGYIRVINHGVDQKLVNRSFATTANVLKQELDQLWPYNTPDINQFRGLQLKQGDPKRLFLVGHESNVWMKGHEALTNNGIALFDALQPTAKDMIEVISLIYEGKTDGLLAKQIFGDTLEYGTKPVAASASMRQIYYPDANQLKKDNATITDTLSSTEGDQYVRLEPHLDYGYITVLPASEKEGLYVLPHSVATNYKVETEVGARSVPLDKWIKVQAQPGELLIQLGRQMDLATKRMANPISATWHAVLATEDELKEPRTSAALFLDNKYDPVYDYKRYIDMNAGHLDRPLEQQELVVVTHQFPHRKRFEVDSLIRLMVEKWKSEGNRKGNEKAEDIIERYQNFAQTVANVITKNSQYLSAQPTTQK